VSKLIPAACVGDQRSLQFPAVSPDYKLTSREAKQVTHEPNTAQGKQVWRAKQGASPREALGEVEAQPRLLREDKGNTLLSFGSVAYASRETELKPQRHKFLLASPNPKALVSSAKFAPQSEVKGHLKVLIELLMQLQHLRVLTKFLTARLELKH